MHIYNIDKGNTLFQLLCNIHMETLNNVYMAISAVTGWKWSGGVISYPSFWPLLSTIHMSAWHEVNSTIK